jgi:hypothetical protein
MPGVAGRAADLCRETVSRHLSFSEPERLLLKGCCYAAFATALTITGGIGMMVSAVTFPVVPTAMLLLAATTIAGIFEVSAEMADYEQRNRDSYLRLADVFADEIARLQLQSAIAKTFQAVGARQEREGVPAASGEMAEGGGDRLMPSAIHTAKVIRPDYWR